MKIERVVFANSVSLPGVEQGIESDRPWGDDGVQGWDVEGTRSTSAVGWEDGELHDPCGEYIDDGV
jgi:hypothetical protein